MLTAKPSIVYNPSIRGVTKTPIRFEYNDRTYSWIIEIPNCLIQGAQNVPRGIITAKCAEDGYFKQLATDPAQDAMYEAILTKFTEIKQRQKLTDDQYVELLCAFVQTLEYGNPNKKKKGDLYFNYPVETVASGKGVCSDKALLLAGLLARAGYGSALIAFYEINHAVCGILVDNPERDGYCGLPYALIETTRDSLVGDYAINNTGHPTVYKIGTGQKTYKSISETQNILKRKKRALSSINLLQDRLRQYGEERIEKVDVQINSLFNESKILNKKIRSMVSTPEREVMDRTLHRISHEIDKKIDAVNKDIRTYNSASEKYNQCIELIKSIDDCIVDRKRTNSILKRIEKNIQEVNNELE